MKKWLTLGPVGIMVTLIVILCLLGSAFNVLWHWLGWIIAVVALIAIARIAWRLLDRRLFGSRDNPPFCAFCRDPFHGAQRCNNCGCAHS